MDDQCNDTAPNVPGCENDCHDCINQPVWGQIEPGQTRAPPAQQVGNRDACLQACSALRRIIIDFQDNILAKDPHQRHSPVVHVGQPSPPGQILDFMKDIRPGEHIIEFRHTIGMWNPVLYYDIHFEWWKLFERSPKGDVGGPRAIILKSDGTWWSDNSLSIFNNSLEWSPTDQGDKQIPADSIVVSAGGSYFPRFNAPGTVPPQYVILDENNYKWRPAVDNSNQSPGQTRGSPGPYQTRCSPSPPSAC